ncbi:MAG: hypothetical protein LBB79_09620 [Prevotellaceae bacterium]|jgi:hypothetical protein|nr:hypothetical protein [Prevotellaceae bacterium]
MKRNYNSKSQLAFAVALCMCLPSCMDSVDLNNLSTDMKLGGTLAAPIGSTEFTIKELLERYKPEDSLISIRVDDDKTVMLYAENVVDYETPDLSEKFKALADDVMNYSIKTQPLNLENVGFSVGITPHKDEVIEQDTTMAFDFNNLNDDNSSQEISRILFKKTNVKVTVDTYGKSYPAGFLVITMPLPGTTDSIVIDASTDSVYPKENLTVKMGNNAVTSYTTRFKITGNGTTEIAASDMINITVAFTESDYVVYGHFYYNDGERLSEPYEINLFDFMPEGTDLRFFAPSLKFNLSSNIGIPFIFDMDTITSTIHGEANPKHIKVTLNKNNVVYPADAPEKEAVSVITIDNSSFPNNNASDIFSTGVSSIAAAYTFRAPERGDSLADKEQFIASNGKLKLTASIQMPFWLDTGSVIAYADTLDGIDVEDFDYITNASLIFTYTSRLPIGFDVTIALLDERKREIAVEKPDKYRYQIEAASVDGNGVVSNPKKGEFSINYDSSIINDLKKAKHLVIRVKATGATPNSKIKITDNDGLTIKAGLRTEAGFQVEN